MINASIQQFLREKDLEQENSLARSLGVTRAHLSRVRAESGPRQFERWLTALTPTVGNLPQGIDAAEFDQLHMGRT